VFNPYNEATKEEIVAFIESEGFTPGDDLETRYNDWWYSYETTEQFISEFVKEV